METYSQSTNIIRWIGLGITSLAIAFCIFGYMGVLEVKLDSKTSYLEELIFFSKIHINVYLIKYYSYSIIILAILDFLFSLNKHEVYFYKAQDQLRKYIEENMEDFETQATSEARKDMFKKDILNSVNN